MITEDYVSFEIAKLLKEKGFYTPYCYSYYFPELKSKTPCISNRVIPKDTDKYLAPILQMAMKWLREVHKLFIEIAVGDYEGRIWYDFDVINIGEKDIPIVPIADIVEFKTYEEAVEAALKYCLTNLI